jgi:hypothetical protein
MDMTAPIDILSIENKTAANVKIPDSMAIKSFGFLEDAKTSFSYSGTAFFSHS